MSRFRSDSFNAINQFINESIPKNTTNNKQFVWKQFESFCQARHYVLDENTSIARLSEILQDWAFNMKKKDGTEYKEYTLKTIWNVTAKILMDKYHNDYNITFNPFKDIVFKKARDAKNAKRKQLQLNPEKRKVSSVFLKYEEFMNLVNTCDERTPDGLQKKLFFVLSYELAWRGGEGSKCLLQFFKEEIDNSGGRTGRIEYNPVFSKTTQGGEKPCASSKWLIINRSNPDICPIRLYYLFLQKREKVTCTRLFLTSNPAWKSGKWYKNLPAGRNTISQWTSNQAKMSGLATDKIKLTNHSLRATAVSKLAKKGVAEQQLIKMTGHSNPKSIVPYIQMDEEHHKDIVEKMRDNDQVIPQPQASKIQVLSNELFRANASSTSASSTIIAESSKSTSQSTNYYNCVFNYHN